MKKFFFLIILSTAVFFASGCGPSSVVVREKPYPPRIVQPLAPGPGYIWVSGEWVPRHGTYIYKQGYWVRARRGHSNYIGGYWKARRGGWTWVPGHWRRY